MSKKFTLTKAAEKTVRPVLQIPYEPFVETGMQRLYESMNEKDRRHYAGIEAWKIFEGGVTYVSMLLGCSRTTVYQGLEEVKKNQMLLPNQIRRKGSGRKSAFEKYVDIDEVFLKVIDPHIAGDPMNAKIRWVKLSRSEMSEAMAEFGIKVDRSIVKKLLKNHDFVKRKMQRKRAIGKSAVREEQFQNIITEKEKAMLSSNPVLSFDTKKKEQVGGNLHRSGSVYCTQAIEVSDHDYPYLADLKIAPHGIFDMKKNKAYVSIGTSAETAEFICDSIKNWWFEMGQIDYPNATEIIGFCDAGGANSYRHHIFKIELQKIADAIGLPIKIIHYPPYTSKWNPIEHRVFPHITRALEGVPLQTVEEAKSRIESTKTRTGLTVTAKIINKTYETGKKVTKALIAGIKIRVGDSLPNLNYVIYPSGGK